MGVQASASSALDAHYPAGDPKLIRIAVMGNDAKAGTVVWGREVGELTDQNIFKTFTFTGLKPDAHYVAVLYSPYLGFGNLRPFSLYCFRTAPDPNPITQHTGCFAHPTLGYTACVAARNACNAASDTTWENGRNRCIPAGN